MVSPTTPARPKSRITTRLCFPALALLVVSSGGFRALANEEIQAGPQFQVSDIASGYAYEFQPSVASDAQGNFVVVWRDYLYGPPYGSQIQARRFGSDGAPAGPQFQVGTATSGYVYETQPSVAADADGDFVVVWRDYDSYAARYGSMIQARRFAADGTPAGGPFLVGSRTTGYAYEFSPSVASDADGDFVVVWRDYQYPGPPAGILIQGRRFAFDGTPSGPQFQVSDITAGYNYEFQPSVASDADGDFVVVWRDYDGYGPRYGSQIRGRRFASNGIPAGSQFQVSSIPAGYAYENEPSVASDTDGDFVVVWRDYLDDGPRYGHQIQARRFAADGTPDGDQFSVSSRTTAGYAGERGPSVASGADGDFVVVWSDYQYPGPPSGVLIQGRRFEPDGTATGDQFQVSDVTAGENFEFAASVAADANGDFVVVWSDYQYTGPRYGFITQGRQFLVGIAVEIDIMPSDSGNNLNLRAGKGATIGVAILTVDDFDAPNRIDPSTLEFGPRKAGISGSPHTRDADGDGDEDLLVKFLTQETGIPCGDTRAILRGHTVDSQPITGSDAINTFNCPRDRKRH